MTLRYPVAANADAALGAPLGFAMREREAAQIAAGQPLSFVTELVGPAWPSEEAARDAYATALAAEPTGWWSILPVSAPAPGAGRKTRRPVPVKPVYRDGRRWPTPEPAEQPKTAWRLSIRYWRIGGPAVTAPSTPARKVRRDPTAAEMEAEMLRLLAEQPLRAAGPQRALDIGLFEIRLPDAPHIIMPDE